MKVSDQFPSKYLRVEDLDDADMTLTIKRVTTEDLGQGNEKQRKIIVYFRECEKGLACNKTNAGVIAKLYGDDTDMWLGKRITLWPNHDVEFKGEIVSAIRVRSKAPAPTTNGAATNGNGVLTFKNAVELCERNGIAVQELKDYLKSCGVNGWTPDTAAQCSELTQKFIAGLVPPTTDANEDVQFS
jgi:hypothetical protein